jgi:hypothetical protein
VKRLLISEAVGRLASALAHGDIGATRFERWKINYRIRRRRWAELARETEAWYKANYPRPEPETPWQPRIFYFEEGDLPMLPKERPRILPEIVMRAGTPLAEIERIRARQAREREVETLLRFYDEELYRSRQQLERIKAEIARTI